MGDKHFDIPKFDFKGIRRITIPKLNSDFTANNGYGWDIIKKFLPSILATHVENKRKIDYLYSYFLGEQDIQAKKRKHDMDSDNNNIEIENHANRQVEFKVGFLCGEVRDYTHKSDSDSDDLIYLDRYFTDCKFFTKDIDLKEWVYATGIGVTETKLRTDIIVTEQKGLFGKRTLTRYKTQKDGFNIAYEAPFSFECVDPRYNFVVYSSSTSKEPLMCIKYVEVDVSDKSDDTPQYQTEIIVETRYAWFKFNADNKFGVFYWDAPEEVKTVAKSLHYLPLIEFSVNKDRIGLVEKNRSAFNTINLFRSSVNDMVVDNANSLLVFKNVDIDNETIKEMIKAGAVIIRDGVNGATTSVAGLTTVTIEIPFDKMATYIDQVMQNAYDIAGVPLASGQVTSGGDTGQARMLGGGWSNAYTIINKEKLYIQGIDYDQLKLILMLCKEVPSCPLNKIYASQVDINYRVNQNDNYLVKTQGMLNLFQMKVHPEFIMKTGGLSNDIKTDTKEWIKYMQSIGANSDTSETPQATLTKTVAVEQNDNDSQE